MNKIKHTPGPWSVPGTQIAMVYGPKGERVCRLIDRDLDAYLISAAPELLEACELIVRSWKENSQISDTEIVEAAENAINKATKPPQ